MCPRLAAMQLADDDDDDAVAPPEGVRLRDPDDTDGVRDDIESGVMKAMQSYVHGYEYGGTRLELSDLNYTDKPRYSLAEQREALLKDSTLARRLRGTVTLVDTETNKPLEVRKNMTLARVPYLTQRGTMIHNGSEYAPVSQSRLLPGAYTRKRNNGELETHFNVRPGSGSAMRMSLDPTTGQYRLRVGTSNVHAYSVFKDLGVGDEELERRWGPEILEVNRKGYDTRAVDRVYMKAIPKWLRDSSLPKADKARSVVEAFSRAQVAGTVLRDNLPNLYSREKAASWRLHGHTLEKLGAAQVTAPSKPRAVIVKGNPHYIDGNPKADAFYKELADLVRANGYEPSFDAGEPHTSPDESAALWVGHSRGQDRLRFAPQGVKTLAVDQFEDRAKERREANAKLMEEAGYKSWAEWPVDTRPPPPDEHYQVTDDLRRALAELAVEQPETEPEEEPVRPLSLAEATKAILLKRAAASPVKFKPTAAPTAHHRYLADDDEHEAYESIGIDGLLAASEKLLAVNRGIERPDQRDIASNDRVYTVDRLMAERVKLDHGKTLRTLMGRLSRRKNLSALGPAAFDAYTVDYLKGNPTATAIEEINPMNIMEQRRRITKMGPGGIGDPAAITIGMQSVDASQFGFVSPSEGPECFDGKTEVFTSRGWVTWPDVADDELFACRVNGKLEWHKAERVVRAPYSGVMIVGEHETIRMVVTPNHRVLNTRDVRYRIDTAEEVFGKSIRVPIRHEPYEGDATMTTFSLPEVPITNNRQRVFEPFEIGDWCAYMGWWLSEGNSHMTPIGKVAWEQHRACITQCSSANPENYQEIKQLCLKMGICDGDNGKTFISGAKQFASYFAQWTDGCYDKWIPEQLQHAPIQARQRMLDALLKGDGRYTAKRHCYCTVSRRLAESVERLAIGLGFTAFIREERDNRPHVTTTNYVVSIHRQSNRKLHSHTQAPHKLNGKTYGDNWRQEHYDGMVYCATVPGGLLHVRGKKSNSGFWSGNSEKAGIDVRLSYGARVGSDGRIYQIMRNVKTGKKQWVSPSDIKGKTVRLPD